MSSPKKFYTVQELADLLQVKPATIRKLAREGKINAIRLGTGQTAQLRFSDQEVERISREGIG